MTGTMLHPIDLTGILPRSNSRSWGSTMVIRSAIVAASLLWALGSVGAQPPGWKHSGSMIILTTPDGANMPASATVENFPLLVRLHRDFFDFTQAKPNGDDLRFTMAGMPLAYQIEDWNAAGGSASIWVRVPKITGNARQELSLLWGNPTAKSESDGKAVFNDTNGYLSVWHLGDTVNDEVGTLETKDTGTTATTGIIGKARNFPGQKGLFGGEKITGYPVGSSPHSTEVWFRAAKTNGSPITWGNEQAQGKVAMQHRSPSHINMDCYFSDGNVTGKRTVPLDEWSHVVHTYEKGNSRLYVNGVLDRASTRASAPLNIRSPARLWIGGWYHNYNFVGDIDEVRVSNVARSPDWIHLQYENQKPNQSLVGLIVQPGDDFSVSETNVTVAEGKSVTLTAKANGAQKLYWIVKRDGRETVAATDRFTFTFNAGRVVGNSSATVQCKAVYPGEVKTREIGITIQEAVPEPVFSLKAPATWDGRTPIEVAAQLQHAVGKLNYRWNVSEMAVIREIADGKLILKRAQNSGLLKVQVAIDNGGTSTVREITIAVREPDRDPWITRLPGKDEKPEEGQFYARDEKNEGTLHYNGTLGEPAENVFLKLYADDKLVNTVTRKPAADKSYTLSTKLKPGLIRYKVEFGTKSGNAETILHRVSNIVCGDAFLIDGQSNAEATDVGRDDPNFTSEWIRSFGSMGGNPQGKRWGHAVVRNRNGGHFQIGFWGMELAKQLLDAHQMPICFINGAVGGSRIDAHQRNHADPVDLTGIYGRLLWRVREAKLTHGIRAVFWHQGENDQGADGPTGGYGYETYQQFFVEMAAGWKTDYPNIRQYYVFQIWPKACAMGINGSDNKLREVQRNLPKLYSNLHIMSTLGIQPPGGCHFPPEGYAQFANLIRPLVERDFYGRKPTAPITPANLQHASFTNGQRDEIALEFDQPVTWDNALITQFTLDGERNKIASGRAQGKLLTLKLTAASTAKTVTYLDSASWNPEHLLRGENGIAALTFCDVPISVKP